MAEAIGGMTESPRPAFNGNYPCNQRCSIAAGFYGWKPESWELPEGATLGAADGRGTMLLPGGLPVPKRVRLCVMHLKESLGCHVPPGPLYQISCVGS